MDEEWDSGADKAAMDQDPYNQFDPMKSVGGPPAKPPAFPVPARSPVALRGGVDDSKRFSQKIVAGKLQTDSSTSFTANLSPEALAFFNKVAESSFSEQASAFLNAYWAEVGSQAEFVFAMAYDTIKYADMRAKGVNYIHLYDEGNDLDFNIGLYFYEQLCKRVLDDAAGATWRNNPQFAPSMPEMMTAIKRKAEIREKVDANSDGRISFLEYLLYQYREFANPADFTERAMKVEGESNNPDLLAAKAALEEVNRAIRAYETEKARLEKESQGSGVKALGATHQLAALHASPLAEKLNTALIKAEAAVRRCSRAGGRSGSVFTKDAATRPRKPTDGSVWWMNRQLAENKQRYGR